MTTRVVSLVTLILFASAPQLVFAHGEESRVAIEADITTPTQAGAVTYKFELVDTKLNQVLKDSDLAITHEKILHMLAYDPALHEFQHVHPTFDGQYWVVDLNFSRNGDYWLWVQGEISSDGEEFSSSIRLQIYGGLPDLPAPPILTDNRNGSDGNSTVQLSSQTLHAGQTAMLDVVLGRNDGTPPINTPYLGAFAHVIVVPEDADSLLHVHPMGGSQSSKGMLHVIFPEARFYRLWVQFIDDGVLRTVPLSVEVFNSLVTKSRCQS